MKESGYSEVAGDKKYIVGSLIPEAGILKKLSPEQRPEYLKYLKSRKLQENRQEYKRLFKKPKMTDSELKWCFNSLHLDLSEITYQLFSLFVYTPEKRTQRGESYINRQRQRLYSKGQARIWLLDELTRRLRKRGIPISKELFNPRPAPHFEKGDPNPFDFNPEVHPRLWEGAKDPWQKREWQEKKLPWQPHVRCPDCGLLMPMGWIREMKKDKDPYCPKCNKDLSSWQKYFHNPYQYGMRVCLNVGNDRYCEVTFRLDSHNWYKQGWFCKACRETAKYRKYREKKEPIDSILKSL